MKKITKRIVYFLLLALSVNALASIGNTMSVGQERMRPGVAEPDTVKPRFAVRRTAPENEADLDKKTMDLRTPDNLKTDTVYDPATGHYTIGTKLGDSYLNAPILMTPEEYQEWSLQKSLQSYYRQKNAEEYANEGKNKFDFTDMQFDLGPAEKIFGPGGVRLRTQGTAELKVGANLKKTDNPSLRKIAGKRSVLILMRK